jgi:translation initiation factor 2-alpha kinase 4
MAPQSPWNKSKQQTTKVTDTSFPGLAKSPDGTSSTQSPYQEIQNDELIALSSIYGEDFHREEETSVAWKVNFGFVFVITLI